MRIGEVAEQAGVSVRALRYYEEQGLVAARRTSGGQRRYPESAVERVRLIQLLYSAGLTSRAILQILPFLDTGIATPEMTRRLADERDRMQGQIEDLARARDRLDELLRLAAAYTPTSPARCTQSPIVVPAGIEQRPERPAHSGGGGARRSATGANSGSAAATIVDGGWGSSRERT